jgi:hypothetical protein
MAKEDRISFTFLLGFHYEMRLSRARQGQTTLAPSAQTTLAWLVVSGLPQFQTLCRKPSVILSLAHPKQPHLPNKP